MKTYIRYHLPAVLCLLVFFNGSPPSGERKKIAYVTNHSHSIVYYKPESRETNPGLDPDGAYPILPGESLYAPVDGIVTSANRSGEIYRVPTGGTVVVNEEGKPEPGNPATFLFGLLAPSSYGSVVPPDPNFTALVIINNNNQ